MGRDPLQAEIWGPIGLRASGPIGRILMDFWASKILEQAEKCCHQNELNPVRYEKVHVHLLHKYVDDCFVALRPMRLGTRWSSKEQLMIWSEEDEKLDRENKVDHEANTMAQFAKTASDQVKCLNFTYDTPKMNENHRMPMLDTEIWVGKEAREVGIPPEILTGEQRSAKVGILRKVILYSFYKKPVSNKVPNRESSAAPVNQKIATCSQEVIRRMKNTSRDLLPNNIEGILRTYMDELIAGGYDQAFREKILEAGTKGFVKMWEQERQGISRINRPEKATRKTRRWNKLCGSRGGDKYPKTQT